MGKIVVMRKGDRFADIFDSPETIKQAQKDGYHLCNEEELQARDALLKADGKKQAGEKTDGNIKPNGNTATLKSLSELSKDELLKFVGKRKLYDSSYKNLEPVAIIPKVLEKARAKIVEAKLKTAEEAAALTEADLLALFDTIGK